ncbi:hypothetical protein GGR58DRAFT_466969 [Xylaria digitata]|nr:hypothetical protein GGR58DRAFT_466969 [Xylaria digitata]
MMSGTPCRTFHQTMEIRLMTLQALFRAGLSLLCFSGDCDGEENGKTVGLARSKDFYGGAEWIVHTSMSLSTY